MKAVPVPEASLPEARAYWDERARRFAARSGGYAAVCSYGMPLFYNGLIHLTQRLALDRWIDVAPGQQVLDVGCGVGRWSRLLALRGARVTGVDLSPTMVEEARKRALQGGLSEQCTFVVQDLAGLDLRRSFPLVLGVTVLQHIMDGERFHEAVARLSAHVAPGGRLVLLEAAPSRPTDRCDSGVFLARSEDDYRSTFSRAGLDCIHVGGVDPAPFRRLLIPINAGLPRPMAIGAQLLVTLASIPVDTLAGRSFVRRSWHKVFVLAHGGE